MTKLSKAEIIKCGSCKWSLDYRTGVLFCKEPNRVRKYASWSGDLAISKEGAEACYKHEESEEHKILKKSW